MARKSPGSNAAAEATSSQAFEAAAREMLETALSLHAGNRPLKCDEIDQLVRSVCSDGKARGLKVERLIIELKHVWYAVPESASHDKAEVISRLVSLCIPAYYGIGADSPKG